MGILNIVSELDCIDWKCFDWIRVVLVWTAPYNGLDETVLHLSNWDYKEWTASYFTQAEQDHTLKTLRKVKN